MNKDKFVNASGLTAALSTFLREAKKIFIMRSSGKDLSSNDYTTEEKAKLDGIAENATKTEKSEINGNVRINDKEETVYTLPTATDTIKGGIILGTGFSVDANGKVNVTATGESGEIIESDPTVPAHVKAITEEQIAAWDNPSISSESDPTVPEWAKAEQKPSYTASEVGAAEESHDHEIEDVNGLQTALDGKAEAEHTHDGSSIESLDASKITGTLAADNIPELDASKITSGTLSPDVLPQGTTTAVTWDSISGKPSEFTPEWHTHAQSEIEGLEDALNNKAAQTHAHEISDVSGLQTALDGKAEAEHTHDDIIIPEISETASGETITLTDAADRPLRSLRVFGKTTQDGTPTPEAPVDFVSIGDDGNIAVTVAGGEAEQTISISTPNGLPGIPVASDGNYTDNDGQQWICDEIDLERGVYVQRVWKQTFADTTNWVMAAASGSSTSGLYRFLRLGHRQAGFIDSGTFPACLQRQKAILL